MGISIGLSRLFYQLREAGILKNSDRGSTTELLIIPMADTVEYAMETASALREAGINTEVYLNEGKMGKKFSYADKLGIRFVSVIGEDEMHSGMLRVKNMASGEQQDMRLENLIEFLKTDK